MSGTLQTLTASYHIVAITYDLIRLVKKVARAKPEAQKWLEHCEDIETIARGIHSELRARIEDREAGVETTSHERAIENVLRKSVRKCRRCVLDMREKLRPLDQISDERPLRNIPERVKFVFDQGFIDSQQILLDRQIRNISLAFHLLESSDRRFARAEQRAETARAQRIEQTLVLLERRLTLHFDLNSPTDDIENYEFITESDNIENAMSGESGPSRTRMRNPQVYEMENDIDSSVGEEDDDNISIFSDSDRGSIDSRNVSRERIGAALRSRLLEAVHLKNIDSTKTWLAETNESELQMRDENGWTLLHHAVLATPEIMRTLLEQPSIRESNYLNAKNNQGQTALMGAAKRANTKTGLELVKVLLKYDCQVNIQDDIGRTALYFVVDRPPSRNSDEVVRLFLLQGCEVTPLIDSDIEDRIKLYPMLKERADLIQKQGFRKAKPRRNTFSKIAEKLSR